MIYRRATGKEEFCNFIVCYYTLCRKKYSEYILCLAVGTDFNKILGFFFSSRNTQETVCCVLACIQYRRPDICKLYYSIFNCQLCFFKYMRSVHLTKIFE